MKNLLLLTVGLIPSMVWSFEPLPSKPPIVPVNNPMTIEKIELGKKLFFDPRLSRTGTVSCNSCHNVMSGGVDNLAKSVGVDAQKGGRNAPTVWNAAFLSVQFWDGRANSLEDQAIGPITNPIEMGMPSEQSVVSRLKGIPEYAKSFASIFGGKQPISIKNVGKAIATYERTLITPDSQFDQYLKGDDQAISRRAKQGKDLFAKIGCTACHSGAAFAGPTLPEGTGFYQKFPTFTENEYVSKYKLSDDFGRYEATKIEADKHLFRVPTLRNIAETAPYFHNGLVKTLDEAVRVMAATQLNKKLTEKEVEQIVAFLGTLTGAYPQQKMPRLPKFPTEIYPPKN